MQLGNECHDRNLVMDVSINHFSALLLGLMGRQSGSLELVSTTSTTEPHSREMNPALAILGSAQWTFRIHGYPPIGLMVWGRSGLKYTQDQNLYK